MVKIFDGNTFAAERMGELRSRVRELQRPLTLVSVVHREDSMGLVYTKLKAKAAAEVGIAFEKVEISLTDPVEKTQVVIREWGAKQEVTGLLVQKPPRRVVESVFIDSSARLPLPSASLRTRNDGHSNDYEEWWGKVTAAIDPKKDVDCLTRVNLDRVYKGESDFLPATARAVVSILTSVSDLFNSGLDPEVVVVGRSELVGKPLGEFLQRTGARVKSLGSRDDIWQNSVNADVVISAVGKPNLITGDMVKQGVIVVDVGEPQGDVEFETVSKKASFITPVPGGVGPVTVVSLLENLVELASGK